MKTYVITPLTGINFAPEDEFAEIVQNVRTILATRKGTVPLHRDFGISWGALDKPMAVAKMLMQAEVIDAITEFEPRAHIDSVEIVENLGGAMNGRFDYKVTISIKEAGEE